MKTQSMRLFAVLLIAVLVVSSCTVAPPANPVTITVSGGAPAAPVAEPTQSVSDWLESTSRAVGDTNFTNLVASGDVTAGGVYYGASSMVFEGSTDDTYETTFAVTDPASSDKTITFPNSTGTVALNPYGASIEFEGATANDFETTLAVADPTTPDKTITLPDATGTVMLSALATNAPDVANSVTGGSNALNFEGSTGANTFQTTISATDPTADRSVVLADAGGTVMLSALATNAAGVANSVTGGSNVLIFEGSAADAYSTSLTVAGPASSSKTVTFADATGTVMLSTLATNAPDVANSVTGASNALVLEGATADTYEASVTLTDPTADRTITLPDATGTVAMTSEGGYFFPMTADAVAQVGDLVMPDAGTSPRFDVNTGSATMPLGVLGGNGPSAQGTSGYPIVFAGLARCAIQEDAAVTFAHWLIVSGTAGKCNDSATITTIGLNVGKALESAVVSNVINNTGCTGGAGCINTALDTPNSGPAGQITLSADVAAQGWAVGDPVIYWNSGGTTPTGLTDGKVYFLVSVSTVNVTLSATKGGAVVVPSTQGDDPTQYLQKLPLAVIQLN